MKNTNSKNGFKNIGAWLKEKVRKFFVMLKKNPQIIPILALSASFLQYSLNLTDISDTTAKIQGPNMGLVEFITMLFLILSFVCMLGAYPKRQKPKVSMILIMLVLYGAVIFCDIHYMGCVTNALYRAESPIAMTDYIVNAYNTTLINIILVGVTIVCMLLEPVFAELLKKIKTSIDVEGSGDIANIDIADED